MGIFLQNWNFHLWQPRARLCPLKCGHGKYRAAFDGKRTTSLGSSTIVSSKRIRNANYDSKCVHISSRGNMYAQNCLSGYFRVLFELVLTEAERNVSYRAPKGSIGARHSSGRAQDSPSAAAEQRNNFGEISPFAGHWQFSDSLSETAEEESLLQYKL